MMHPCVSNSPILRVAVDTATSPDTTLVAAAGAGKKIRVLAGSITMTGTAVTIRFESGAGGTALTGQMTPAQGQTISLPWCPVGHFETAENALLNLELGGAQSVDGWLVYQVIGGI
jgi:ABC-type nitrate/sulfonate/bicarbonate transport system substrate-binding protein